MANWSDPRSTGAPYAAGTATEAGAVDAGLRSYMLTVYNFMMSGVLLTGIVAMFFASSGAISMLYNTQTGGASGLGWIVMLSPLAIVFAMSFGMNKMSKGTLQALFWGFAVLMGASLSSIFLVYTSASIASVFFATAAGFAGLSLYGYTTKRDLGPIGTFLIMGLFGLIVAMLLNAFIFQSQEGSMIISALGVLIFAGLTAYDTQKIKSMYFQVSHNGELQSKVEIMGALTLYLDFINMFLFLLRLFGSQRS
ncbi:Bax inhibitor-1/YccA family protein [Stakelama tenebrarum]|uniref:Bax inhibitor-1/YccA family protein n=1 Tax=Stakelama tenebrarum TaxID=2711215 RepID=A0A6G6Y3W4_9SPHN|nr:Bax inhibitor-1/YccA family protein [Sphingosinithalassobacter tenebrarum]QIG79303.1 Bax inhibitor-1/YccA family protein [Sphingosinithalassobacter tenebrarum]